MKASKKKKALIVLNRKFPKYLSSSKLVKDKIKPRSRHWLYYNNIFVEIEAKNSRELKNVTGVYTNKGQDRHNICLSNFEWEGHAAERSYNRNISDEDVLETIKQGWALDCSDRRSKRTKYVWKTIEVLVDESNDVPIIVQMQRNVRWEDMFFIDEIQGLIDNAKQISNLGDIDITVDCHDRTDFCDRMLVDLHMHKAWLGLEALAREGQATGFTNDQNKALDNMKELFGDTWGSSIVWTVSSMNQEQIDYSRAGRKTILGIPSDRSWLKYRHTYYLEITVFYRGSSTIPKRVLELLGEYGITKDAPGCKFTCLGPRSHDLFDRNLSKVTLCPSGSNDWTITSKKCKRRF